MTQILDLAAVKAHELALKDSPIALAAFADMVMSVANGSDNYLAKNTLKSLSILKEKNNSQLNS